MQTTPLIFRPVKDLIRVRQLLGSLRHGFGCKRFRFGCQISYLTLTVLDGGTLGGKVRQNSLSSIVIQLFPEEWEVEQKEDRHRISIIMFLVTNEYDSILLCVVFFFLCLKKPMWTGIFSFVFENSDGTIYREYFFRKTTSASRKKNLNLYSSAQESWVRTITLKNFCFEKTTWQFFSSLKWLRSARKAWKRELS